MKKVLTLVIKPNEDIASEIVIQNEFKNENRLIQGLLDVASSDISKKLITNKSGENDMLSYQVYKIDVGISTPQNQTGINPQMRVDYKACYRLESLDSASQKEIFDLMLMLIQFEKVKLTH